MAAAKSAADRCRMTRAVLAGFIASMALEGALEAQTVSTVRETEFRSRWMDQQVDRPPEQFNPGTVVVEGDDNLSSKVASSLRSLFRTGPIVLRVGLTVGVEYLDQPTNADSTKQLSKTSFFAAPVVAAFYDREVGPWTVSARYSAGYQYYLDQNYVGAGSRSGVPSQTAGLDFRVDLSRLTVRSSAGASYGTGFDVYNNQETERFSVTEALAAEYQLSGYTRAGVTVTGAYERNTVTLDESENSNVRLTGAFYTDYFVTGKMRLRAELNSGYEDQRQGQNTSAERAYTQGLLRVNYQPTDKLAFDVGAGFGLLESTGGSPIDEGGLRMVYSMTASYAPTEKISARLYFGLETTSTQPELSLALDWRPRDTTAFRLSAYQLSGVSSLSFTENRVTRGVLATAQQRFFQRATLNLSSGWEQYENVDSQQAGSELDPYYFIAGTLTYEFSRWLMLEALYRTSSRQGGSGGAGGQRENRASLSLRLTF
jgi:hypothetical protein